MRQNAVLDIGSSKIVCICGSVNGRNGIAVHGAGVREYPGFCEGTFVDRQETIEMIMAAIEDAEKESHTRIREVALAVPSAFAKLILSEAEIEVSSRQGRISDEDIDALINESVNFEAPEGYLLIHSTPVAFFVDGEEILSVPIGQTSEKIAGKISHVYASEEFLGVVREALQEMDIRISMCVSSALAEALLLVPEKERIRPTVLVDVGYYHTDICVIENTALVEMASLGIGGMFLANDLSLGLEVPAGVAEQLKRRYVFSLNYQDSEEIVRTAKGSRSVRHADVQYILEARAEEIARMIGEQVGQWDVNLRVHPVMYFTGGGMMLMRGAQEFLERILAVRVKRDMPWMPRLSSANYASAYGVLDFVLHSDDYEDTNGLLHSIQDQAPVFKRLIGFFK